MEGRERPKKEADVSTWAAAGSAAGSVSKGANRRDLSWKVPRLVHLCTRHRNHTSLYRALNGIASHIQSRSLVLTRYSQGCVLEPAPRVGMVGRR